MRDTYDQERPVERFSNSRKSVNHTKFKKVH